MIVFVLGWLAVSIVAVLAYTFGASVGFRRGLELGRTEVPAGPASRRAGSADIAVELRLPEEAHRAT